MKILGISGALDHDPSAALFIDGKLVAAAEEERQRAQAEAELTAEMLGHVHKLTKHVWTGQAKA